MKVDWEYQKAFGICVAPTKFYTKGKMGKIR